MHVFDSDFSTFALALSGIHFTANEKFIYFIAECHYEGSSYLILLTLIREY